MMGHVEGSVVWWGRMQSLLVALLFYGSVATKRETSGQRGVAIPIRFFQKKWSRSGCVNIRNISAEWGLPEIFMADQVYPVKTELELLQISDYTTSMLQGMLFSWPSKFSLGALLEISCFFFLVYPRRSAQLFSWFRNGEQRWNCVGLGQILSRIE